MLTWYLARAAGVTAFGLLSVATAAGALTSRKTATPSGRVVTQYVHRSAAVAGLTMLALHVVTILADSYAHVGFFGAVLPFASTYRPVAVTFGLLGLYLLAAVAVTGLLRSRFTYSDRAVRQWRGVHLLSYGAWASAAWHFWTAGTDAGQLWARMVLFSGIALIGLGFVGRLSDRPAGRPMPVRIGGRA